MTTQQRRTKAPSEALPSDGLSRFIRAGAWAAIVSGLALVASLLLEWLVVPFEQLGETEAYLTGSYFLSSGLRLLSTVLLGVGAHRHLRAPVEGGWHLGAVVFRRGFTWHGAPSWQ
jgi:hypothetical protein